MSVGPEIILTADGSHTLFVPELDEHYHSVNGAIQESIHIFINTGLHHIQKETIRIFEVGFGTGLNAFLTITDQPAKEKTIHYTAIEAYPLPISLTSKLNYTEQYTASDQLLFQNLHEAEWDRVVEISPHFYLKKLIGDLTAFDYNLVEESVDIIYFDAFAPDKQPDMWTQDIFDRMYAITAPQGILVTYCAKGSVRRMMQQAGYTVERLPGPPGKREMLRVMKSV